MIGLLIHILENQKNIMYKHILAGLLFCQVAQAGNSCTSDMHDVVFKFLADASIAEMSEYNNPDGFMEIVLANRHKHELLCAKSANCFNSEPNKSMEFHNCLNGFTDEQID